MQKIDAQIISESNGQPVSGAVIYSADPAGNLVPVARAADDGSVSLMVPETSPAIMVTAPNFAPAVVDPGTIQDTQQIELKETSLQDAATLQIKNTSLSRVPVWVWVGGTAVMIWAITSDGKGKNSLSGKGPDFSKYILPVGLIAGLYLVLNKFGLFGNTDKTTNNKLTAGTIAQGTADTLKNLAAAGQGPTLSTAQAASIANNIYYAGIHVTSTDLSGISTIFNQLAQVKNDADIYLIMQNFGARNVSSDAVNLCSIFSISCDAVDLDSFVTAVVNQASVPGLQLSDLNYQISHDPYGNPNGVTYQF